MTQREIADLQQLRRALIHDAPSMAGPVLWWRRTNTALDIIRQRDGAWKHQDLGEGHPSLPADTISANRVWALQLAMDPLTQWQEPEKGKPKMYQEITIVRQGTQIVELRGDERWQDENDLLDAMRDTMGEEVVELGVDALPEWAEDIRTACHAQRIWAFRQGENTYYAGIEEL